MPLSLNSLTFKGVLHESSLASHFGESSWHRYAGSFAGIHAHWVTRSNSPDLGHPECAGRLAAHVPTPCHPMYFLGHVWSATQGLGHVGHKFDLPDLLPDPAHRILHFHVRGEKASPSLKQQA